MEEKEMGTIAIKKEAIDKLSVIAYQLQKRGEEVCSFQLFQILAETEDPDAINRLARCYYKGIGTEKDLTKAFELTKQAERFGASYAGGNVALCFYEGEGIAIDYERAFFHAKQAVEKNRKDLNGLMVLGLCYGYGRGVEQDRTQGEQLLQEAIKRSEGEKQQEIQKKYEELKVNLKETKADEKSEETCTKKEQITKTLRTLIGLLEEWEKE